VLLKAGADKDANIEGCTALMVASEQGHDACVELLLNAGADKDATNKEGSTALMASHLQTDARCVFKYKCDVDMTNDNGSTAVMIATAFNQHECVRLLMKRGGANVDIAGQEGMTPLEVAKRGGWSAEVIEQLEKVCAACHKRRTSAAKKCSRCMRTYYCDAACQKAHWPTHKHECKAQPSSDDDDGDEEDEDEEDAGEDFVAKESATGGGGDDDGEVSAGDEEKGKAD
jgi:hypothetical protein